METIGIETKANGHHANGSRPQPDAPARAAARRTGPVTGITKAAMLRQVDAMLRRLEAWSVENKADIHWPEHGKRARAVAFAEIRDTVERALDGDLHPLWDSEAADRWIDAALAAGVSFERHAANKPGGVEITYRMRYDQVRGAQDIAHALTRFRSYGPKVFDAALARRLDPKNDAMVMGRSSTLDGDYRQYEHFHSLRETHTKLELTRAKEKAAYYQAAYYGVLERR